MNRRIAVFLLVSIVGTHAGIASAGIAGLTGDTVSVAWRNTSNPGDNRSENVVVAVPGAEIQCPSTSDFCRPSAPVLVAGESIDIGASSIRITFNDAFVFPTATFVGFDFGNLDFDPAGVIAAVSATSSGLTGFSALSAVSYTSSLVSLNLSGVTPSRGGFLELDLTFRSTGSPNPVPEPGSMALLLLGVGALLARRRPQGVAPSQ